MTLTEPACQSDGNGKQEIEGEAFEFLFNFLSLYRHCLAQGTAAFQPMVGERERGGNQQQIVDDIAAVDQAAEHPLIVAGEGEPGKQLTPFATTGEVDQPEKQQ